MVIADTGFWFALANRRDRFHDRSKAWLDAMNEPLITTWPVMAETCHLLLHRIGADSQRRYLLGFKEGGFQLFDLQLVDLPRMTTLMQKYADLPMDLADASLVLLAEQLGHGRILSTDQRDFHAYRWKQREPFRNLLLEQPR